MTDLSIIVVASDVRAEVLQCLGAIDEHRGSLDVETILVDNASSDGTVEAVMERFEHVKIERLGENRGVAARNNGLRLASGRYRMFLDSDAFVTRDALTTLVRFMEDHPEVGLAGPRLVYPDGTLQLSARRFPPLAIPFLRRPPLVRFFGDGATVRHHLMADEPHDHAREVEYVLGACQLFRAEAQRAAGEVDPWMFYGPDDVDWCLRIRMAGFRVAYVPQATVIHGYRRSTAARPVSPLAARAFVNFYRFQWKWRHHRRRLMREGEEMDARPRLG
ncbi:MAG: glycosyltransferase family 2 protein [Actinomycetota bacterium]|nr:glycosyltransferase family 2 protein [Actinomycetota bacterium]